MIAFAARLLFFQVASSLFALQLTFRSLAVSWLDALVSAVQFFTNRRAFWIRGCASGVALRRSAHGFTFRARILFTFVLGATNAAHWSFAMYNTFGTRSLFASHFTFRAGAHWVADSRASGVIALPSAVRVALVSGRKGTSNEQAENNNTQHFYERGKQPNKQAKKMVCCCVVVLCWGLKKRGTKTQENTRTQNKKRKSLY